MTTGEELLEGLEDVRMELRLAQIAGNDQLIQRLSVIEQNLLHELRQAGMLTN